MGVRLRLILFFILFSTMALAQRHHIAVTYSEPVDASALEVGNYTVFDAELNEIGVLNVWEVTDSIYAVVVDFLAYKSNFSIRAENIKDLAGNYINENNSAWFYFDGYDITEPQPYLIMRQDTEQPITNLLRHTGGGWYSYKIWWTPDTLYLKGIDTLAFYKYPKLY